MIKLIDDIINREDISALCEWLQQEPTPKLTKGELTRELEGKWAKLIGTKHSVFVNSGSSAILLLLAAYKEILGRMPKIVVPALSWATDVSSPMLLGYNIVGMCDCNEIDLSCSLCELEYIFKWFDPDVFLLVSPLGLVPNMTAIVGLCNQYGVKLLEDNCESLGSRHRGKMLGSFGYASVFSTYYGHHISTIEGGFVNTNNNELNDLLLSMRSHGWDRDWDKKKKKKEASSWLVNDFKSLYTFYHPGMNVRSTDLQAFIGLRVLDRLDAIAKARNKNFYRYLKGIKHNMIAPVEKDGDFVSNFAYPLVLPKISRIVDELRNNNIEVRPLIAGSMGRAPFWVKKYGVSVQPVADMIDRYGIYLPNHPSLKDSDIDTIIDIVNKYA